jgi:hypothetical protein
LQAADYGYVLEMGLAPEGPSAPLAPDERMIET